MDVPVTEDSKDKELKPLVLEPNLLPLYPSSSPVARCWGQLDDELLGFVPKRLDGTALEILDEDRNNLPGRREPLLQLYRDVFQARTIQEAWMGMRPLQTSSRRNLFDVFGMQNATARPVHLQLRMYRP